MLETATCIQSNQVSAVALISSLAFTISTRRFFRTCDFVFLIEFFQGLRFGMPWGSFMGHLLLVSISWNFERRPIVRRASSGRSSAPDETSRKKPWI